MCCTTVGSRASCLGSRSIFRLLQAACSSFTHCPLFVFAPWTAAALLVALCHIHRLPLRRVPERDIVLNFADDDKKHRYRRHHQHRLVHLLRQFLPVHHCLILWSPAVTPTTRPSKALRKKKFYFATLFTRLLLPQAREVPTTKLLADTSWSSSLLMM